MEYIANYDAVLLTELAQRFTKGTGELSDYEFLLIQSCVQAFTNIKGKKLCKFKIIPIN
jgi:hypothetical protein